MDCLVLKLLRLTVFLVTLKHKAWAVCLGIWVCALQSRYLPGDAHRKMGNIPGLFFMKAC